MTKNTIFDPFWPFQCVFDPFGDVIGQNQCQGEKVPPWGFDRVVTRVPSDEKKIFVACRPGGYMTPMTSSGAIFGSKISNTLFLYFFWPPKKFSKIWRARKILTPFLTPPRHAKNIFWGVDIIFKKCPRGNLGSVQSLKKIVTAVFEKITNAPNLVTQFFEPLQDLIRAPVSRLAKTKFLSNHFFSLRSRKDWKANFSDLISFNFI